DKNKIAAAQQVFHGIGAGSKVTAQAAYYSGVALVTLGKYGEAIPEFDEAAKRADTKTVDGKAVRDLALLSTARLYQELGMTEKAVDSYNMIAADSKEFSESMFELAWAHVKAANSAPEGPERDKKLSEALKVAELLMASGPDVKLFPEA